MAPTPSKLPVVTAFGGGHGLAVSLRALRRLTDQLTAVVTVADNGGSSGRLRDEFDILPPVISAAPWPLYVPMTA